MDRSFQCWRPKRLPRFPREGICGPSSRSCCSFLSSPTRSSRHCPHQHLCLGCVVAEKSCYFADPRAQFCIPWGLNDRTGLLFQWVLVLRIELIRNFWGTFHFALPHNKGYSPFTAKSRPRFGKEPRGLGRISAKALQRCPSNLKAQNGDNGTLPLSELPGMPAKLGRDFENGSDPLQSPPIPTVELSHGVRQIGDRGLAPCVQSADGAQAREFLQDEIEIRRGATFATLEFGAAFTTTFDWLPHHQPIHIFVITRPGLPLRVLCCPSDRLHFVVRPVAVGDLHKLSVT